MPRRDRPPLAIPLVQHCDVDAASPSPPADPGGTGLWAGRPVLITGATGFLGSDLTWQLVNLGADVVVLVRDALPSSPQRERWRGKVTVVDGAVEDQAAIERVVSEYAVKTVFHLAAQSQIGVANTNPTATFDTNIRGTWSVLEAVRRSGHETHVIVASSDKAYGSQPALPYTEDMPLLGRHPYDASKACADLLAQSYAHSFGVTVGVTRCGNLFGPGDVNWERLIPGTLRSLLAGQRPIIRSDGSATRDYLYVEDASLAYLRLAEGLADGSAAPGACFNFSNERPLSVLEMVGELNRAAGTAIEPDVRATARNEIDHQFLSSAKARAELGWKPRYSLQDALVPTVKWYRDLLSGP